MFVPDPKRPRPVLLGEGAGSDFIVSFAHQLNDRGDCAWHPLVLIGTAHSLTFRPRPSTILVPGMPDGAIACVPALEEAGIASRLASDTGHPGCYEGDVADLAALWLDGLEQSALSEVAVLACGPPALLQAAAAIAQRYDVPCQTLPK